MALVPQPRWWRLLGSETAPKPRRRRLPGALLALAPYWFGPLAIGATIQQDWLSLERWRNAPTAAISPAAAPASLASPSARRVAGASAAPVPLAADAAAGSRQAPGSAASAAAALPADSSQTVAAAPATAASSSELAASRARPPTAARLNDSTTVAAPPPQPASASPSDVARADEQAPEAAARVAAKTSAWGKPLSAGTSCEAAIAAYREKISMGAGNGPADLTAGQYGAVLNNGRYLNSCGVPDHMEVKVCAAVHNGRALGVTVRTRPGNTRVQRCVARAVRRLSFPSHPRMDVARTVFR